MIDLNSIDLRSLTVKEIRITDTTIVTKIGTYIYSIPTKPKRPLLKPVTSATKTTTKKKLKTK